MQLSIIIPVFKVKENIRECLQSVLAIKGLTYEVILVQDVKADDSLDDVGDLLEQPNICICDQKNAGLSDARNAGLKLAKGEYVYFLDSDDFIDAEAFSGLFLTYYSKKPDMMAGAFRYIDENGNLITEKNKLISATAEGKFVGKDYLMRYYTLPMVWLNIYKMSFWSDNNLSFMQGVYFEDNEFTPRALYLSNEICVTTKPIYYYRIRMGSLSQQSFGEKKLDDSLLVANSLLEFAERRVCEKNIKDFFSGRALSLFFGTLGFFLQEHAVNKGQRQKIYALLHRVSIRSGIPPRFRLMLLIHRISQSLMLNVIKKRYEHKYFKG